MVTLKHPSNKPPLPFTFGKAKYFVPAKFLQIYFRVYVKTPSSYLYYRLQIIDSIRFHRKVQHLKVPTIQLQIVCNVIMCRLKSVQYKIERKQCCNIAETKVCSFGGIGPSGQLGWGLPALVQKGKKIWCTVGQGQLLAKRERMGGYLSSPKKRTFKQWLY